MCAEEAISKWLFLYRATPHATTGETPGKLLIGYKPITRLDKLKPDIPGKVRRNQEKQVESHKRKHVRVRSALECGQTVWARQFGAGKSAWCQSVVVKCSHPLYWVRLSNGQVHKRHINQLYSQGRSRHPEAVAGDCCAGAADVSRRSSAAAVSLTRLPHLIVAGHLTSTLAPISRRSSYKMGWTLLTVPHRCDLWRPLRGDPWRPPVWLKTKLFKSPRAVAVTTSRVARPRRTRRRGALLCVLGLRAVACGASCLDFPGTRPVPLWTLMVVRYARSVRPCRPMPLIPPLGVIRFGTGALSYIGNPAHVRNGRPVIRWK